VKFGNENKRTNEPVAWIDKGNVGGEFESAFVGNGSVGGEIVVSPVDD